MKKRYRVAGVSFEHMHMGDNLRMAAEHPDCEVVGVCDVDRSRMLDVQRELGLADRQLYADWQHCIEECQPDLLVLCPATGDHAVWVLSLIHI